MTTGEFLDSVEGSAQNYHKEVLESLLRNDETYELSVADCADIRTHRKRFQRFAEAILADFINYLALERGGDRGERPSHIRGKR